MGRKSLADLEILYIWKLSDGNIIATCIKGATFDGATFIKKGTSKDIAAMRKAAATDEKRSKARKTKKG